MKKDFSVAIALLIMGIILSAVSAVVAIGTEGTLFARSGSILCLLATVAQFILTNAKKTTIATIISSNDLSKKQKFDMLSNKSLSSRILFGLSITTGLFGTLVWGYGDLLY